LGGVDYILFTAGVGEHQWDVRQDCLAGLEFLGIKLDLNKNKEVFGEEAVISTPDSKVTVAVIPTDEELLVATDTMKIAQEKNDSK
jgi:acetate kinase